MKFNLTELNTIVECLNDQSRDLEAKFQSQRGVDRLDTQKKINEIKKLATRFKVEELG
jgi:hypothetical protein